MSTTLPWQWGNIPGPRTAQVISKAEIAGKLIKASKRPLLAVGAKLLEWKYDGRPLLDFAEEIVNLKKIPVVATSNSFKPFFERDVASAVSMGIVDLTNRLQDQNWSLDGKGAYSLIVFLGVTYQLQSQMLSTLKNFAPHLTTISLDRFYHPNASWSFPNLTEKDWSAALIEILKVLSKEHNI